MKKLYAVLMLMLVCAFALPCVLWAADPQYIFQEALRITTATGGTVLAEGKMLIGQTNGTAGAVTPSGGATISTGGVFTLNLDSAKGTNSVLSKPAISGGTNTSVTMAGTTTFSGSNVVFSGDLPTSTNGLLKGAIYTDGTNVLFKSI